MRAAIASVYKSTNLYNPFAITLYQLYQEEIAKPPVGHYCRVLPAAHLSRIRNVHLVVTFQQIARPR